MRFLSGFQNVPENEADCRSSGEEGRKEGRKNTEDRIQKSECFAGDTDTNTDVGTDPEPGTRNSERSEEHRSQNASRAILALTLTLTLTTAPGTAAAAGLTPVQIACTKEVR
jgi:hypothetical protein